jgi:hypothetical protein
LSISATNSKRETDDRIWKFKTENEEMLKMFKMNITEDNLKFKEEQLQRLEDTDLKIHKEFSKLLDDTTQAIEDSINGNLIGQMKELDHGI